MSCRMHLLLYLQSGILKRTIHWKIQPMAIQVFVLLPKKKQGERKEKNEERKKYDCIIRQQKRHIDDITKVQL